MTKSERTRAFIIERTASIFNKKGFDGTSLQDLTDATGLTKGALYGNFADKEEISIAAFRYSVARVKELVRSRVEAAQTARGQLEALVNFYADYIFNPPIAGGCPMLNRAIEADDQFPAMRRLVAAELRNAVAFIERLIRKGIRNGEFRRDTPARKLAYVFFCVVEGAIMFSRAERSKEPMDIIVRHIKKTLDDISK